WLWAMGSVSAIFTWLALNRTAIPSNWMWQAFWFIPPCLLVVFRERYFNFYARLKWLCEYIYQIEEISFPKDAPLRGMSHYKEECSKQMDRNFLFRAERFWCVLILVSLIASVVLSGVTTSICRALHENPPTAHSSATNAPTGTNSLPGAKP